MYHRHHDHCSSKTRITVHACLAVNDTKVCIIVIVIIVVVIIIIIIIIIININISRLTFVSSAPRSCSPLCR
jgi:hypothetical protein